VSSPPSAYPFPGGLGFSSGVTLHGRDPVWEVGLPEDGVLHLGSFGRSTFGYPSMKVMWLTGPTNPGTVTLSGHDARTGARLWFEIYPSNLAADLPTELEPVAILDPASPNRGFGEVQGGRWAVWGIGIDVLSAGCYTLEATWPGGSWDATVAAGD
jgi:hypothetical protein